MASRTWLYKQRQQVATHLKFMSRMQTTQGFTTQFLNTRFIPRPQGNHLGQGAGRIFRHRNQSTSLITTQPDRQRTLLRLTADSLSQESNTKGKEASSINSKTWHREPNWGMRSKITLGNLTAKAQSDQDLDLVLTIWTSTRSKRCRTKSIGTTRLSSSR